MRMIQAAVCHSFGKPIVIEQVALRPPEGREVEVAIEAVAICHSDISYAEGAWGGSLPAVYGHESAGRVAAVGPGISDLDVGEPVIVTLMRQCGACGSCASGHPALCESPRLQESPLRAADGAPVAQGLVTGAFAERVVVDRSQLVRVPGHLPATSACLLACGVLTGVGAVVNSARLRAGEDAVVIGAGGVGLNAIQGARIAGARRIVAVDVSEAKLQSAAEFGATDLVLADDAPWKIARTALGRGADAVLVTVGAASIYDTATRYLGPGGRLIMVGMPHSGVSSAYEPVILAALGQSMTGSLMGDCVPSRDVPWMVDLYQQGRLKLDELISGRWQLDQINEAIADTVAGHARRNVIVFQ